MSATSLCHCPQTRGHKDGILKEEMKEMRPFSKREGVGKTLTALIPPVAVLKRFTSWPESTESPLFTADEVELAPSPLEPWSISESGWRAGRGIKEHRT